LDQPLLDVGHRGILAGPCKGERPFECRDGMIHKAKCSTERGMLACGDIWISHRNLSARKGVTVARSGEKNTAMPRSTEDAAAWRAKAEEVRAHAAEKADALGYAEDL
jgi:hypothetical protein